MEREALASSLLLLLSLPPLLPPPPYSIALTFPSITIYTVFPLSSLHRYHFLFYSCIFFYHFFPLPFLIYPSCSFIIPFSLFSFTLFHHIHLPSSSPNTFLSFIFLPVQPPTIIISSHHLPSALPSSLMDIERNIHRPYDGCFQNWELKLTFIG